jgi:hypothetical protein
MELHHPLQVCIQAPASALTGKAPNGQKPPLTPGTGLGQSQTSCVSIAPHWVSAYRTVVRQRSLIYDADLYLAL